VISKFHSSGKWSSVLASLWSQWKRGRETTLTTRHYVELFCFAMFLIVGSISQSAGAAIGAAITVRLFMTHWVQWAVEKGAFEQ
jgi:hypothetical protein